MTRQTTAAWKTGLKCTIFSLIIPRVYAIIPRVRSHLCFLVSLSASKPYPEEFLDKKNHVSPCDLWACLGAKTEMVTGRDKDFQIIWWEP